MAQHAPPPREPLRVLGLQIEQQGDKAKNLAKAWEKVQANPGFDIYVLPELSATGYTDDVLRQNRALAERAGGETCKSYQALADEAGAVICFGFLRRCGITGQVHICQAVAAPVSVYGPFDPVRVGGNYDKMHLCDMGDCSEAGQGLTRGMTPRVFSCKGHMIGLAICYDLRFPELWRYYRDLGCDLVLHPSAFSRDATFPGYHPFVTTRAIENGFYVLSVNFAGERFGASIAAPPWVGAVPGAADQAVATLGTKEDVLPLIVDAEILAAVRKSYPYKRNLNAMFWQLSPTWQGVRALVCGVGCLFITFAVLQGLGYEDSALGRVVVAPLHWMLF
mmetsp:Transcript_27827/g.86027  ORF Transcript_27827/g.86027 Transcript_27827/m.86027 type:complete len:335 (-) Transcript_27827:106-1110(-)